MHLPAAPAGEPGPTTWIARRPCSLVTGREVPSRRQLMSCITFSETDESRIDRCVPVT